MAGRDLRGKVALVTGGDGGIGLPTARALARTGARVWIGCLDVASGERAAERIRTEVPGAEVRSVAFDLGDLRAVGRAADGLPEERLDVLVCNAGVYGGPYRRTVDGFERTFAVCYLGHARLIVGLLDRLRAAAPSRVVLVSSQNHRWPTTLDVDALPVDERGYSEVRAYGEAKRCVVLLARALTDRHGHEGVVANALHPGDLVSTGIERDSWVLRVVMGLARPFAPTPEQAAATSAHLATAPELEGIGGRWYADLREGRAAPGAMDPAVAARLWEHTERWLEGT